MSKQNLEFTIGAKRVFHILKIYSCRFVTCYYVHALRAQCSQSSQQSIYTITIFQGNFYWGFFYFLGKCVALTERTKRTQADGYVATLPNATGGWGHYS